MASADAAEQHRKAESERVPFSEHSESPNPAHLSARGIRRLHTPSTELRGCVADGRMFGRREKEMGIPGFEWVETNW